MAYDAADDGGERIPHPIDVAAGLRLRTVRKQRGVSQEQLGSAVGKTFQQIQKYERGGNRISVSMLVLMSNFLGVAPSDLLPPRDGAQGQAPSDVVGLITRFRGCEELIQAYSRIRSQRQRKALLQMARSLAEPEGALPEPEM